MNRVPGKARTACSRKEGSTVPRELPQPNGGGPDGSASRLVSREDGLEAGAPTLSCSATSLLSATSLYLGTDQWQPAPHKEDGLLGGGLHHLKGWEIL